MKPAHITLLLVSSSLVPLFFLDTWFHADDFSLLARLAEHSLQSSAFWRQILLGEVFEGNTNYFYRPLTMLVLGTLEQGGSVIPFRIFALTLHSLSTLTLYVLINRTQSSTTALISALFFSLHPVVTTALYSIAAFGDLLFVFFGLLGAVSFVTYLESDDTSCSLMPTLASLLLALGSKETALCLPLLYSLYTFVLPKRRGVFAPLALLYLLCGGFFILRGILLGSFLAGNAAGTYHHFGIQSFVAAVRYIVDLVVPVPLDTLFHHPWILLLWGAVLIPLLFSFRLRWLPLCITALLLSLFPAFHHYGGWYVYGATAVSAVILSFAFRKLPARYLLVLAAVFCLTSFASQVRQARCFAQSGRLNYALLFDVAHRSQPVLTLLGVPKTLCSHAPMFTWSKQVEYGLAHHFDQQKRVELLAQPVLDSLSQQDVYKLTATDEALTLSLKDTTFSYFSLGEPDWSKHVSLSQTNWLQKPTSVSYSKLTEPLLWSPAGVQSATSLPNEPPTSFPNASKQQEHFE